VRQLASTSTIQAHLKHLQRAGAIELRDGVPRSVRVLWPRPKRRRGG
jgi:SOS-response transcriptional repressor LexA